MTAILEVRDLVVRYGGNTAVKGASLTVEPGEIVTIIGSNGAGKSSLLNAIVGLVRPGAGEVTFGGKRVTGWPAHRVQGLGMGMVPEGRRLFPEMTVMENLTIGAYRRSDRSGISADIKRVFEIFPRLRERRGQLAQTLSGGEQQMVAIGRALMSRAHLLLLDEPSLGLSPIMVRAITDAIREVHQRDGVAVVLVEQNARMALSLAQRAYVLETGSIVAEGTAADVGASELVHKAYLGL